MSVKDLIETFYGVESTPDFDKERLPITFRLNERSLQMLQALADRFKQSRAGFGADLLESAIFEAFDSLSQDDQSSLASKSDAALKIAGFPPYWIFQSEAFKVASDVEKNRLLSDALGGFDGPVPLPASEFLRLRKSQDGNEPKEAA